MANTFIYFDGLDLSYLKFMRLLIYIEIIMWASNNICTYSEHLFYIPYFAVFTSAGPSSSFFLACCMQRIGHIT